VFEDFPDSPYAPPAILKVAEMIYPVAAWDQIGSASPDAIKQAGELLAALAQKYRSSHEAPRALVKLGYLAIEPANPKADLDEAYGGSPGGKGSDGLTIRGASDIAIDAQGLAVVSSPKSPGVFRLDPKGRIQERIAHPGPEFVAPGDGLAVYISGRDQVAVN